MLLGFGKEKQFRMKNVYTNRRPVSGPWGGGNKFVKELSDRLKMTGINVSYDLSSNIDIIFCFDPRPDSEGVWYQDFLNHKSNFGTKIIISDICKITTLTSDIVENIISDNVNINKISDQELLEEKYFNNQQYRKIKKNLIAKIAEARINELSEKLHSKNINLKKLIGKTNVIFLEINDPYHLTCFNYEYEKSFAFNNQYEVKIVKKPEIEQIINKAENIVQFGWKKEAIPVTKSKKTILTRIFQEIFH